DLTKPSLLEPILTARGLRSPVAAKGNIAPSLGLAWSSADGRTVLRGGTGRYFDPAGGANSANLTNERSALLPAGTGRVSVSGSNIFWNGGPLNFRRPTSFTAGDLLSILPQIRGDLLGTLNPGNRDFAVRNIDRTKEGS